MPYEFKLVSSLEKNFFAKPDHLTERSSGSMLKNEIHSFQLIGWGTPVELPKRTLRIEVESALAPHISIYKVDYVPVMMPIPTSTEETDFLFTTPGMAPDPLHRIRDGYFELYSGQSRALWITVEPNGAVSGQFPITLRIFDDENQQIGLLTYNLEIINAELPPLPICNTGWFHGDCLATHHNVELLSDAYFDIVEKYLAVYVKFGHNMILTPVFTPPLDTAVGAERPTNQLVEVTVQGGQYSFDFKNLKRWIDLCQKHGIRYFEISHLFTQWGVEHAPKVMATVDGEYKRIFGWETDATSPEYAAFLDAFLPELKAFLQAEGIFDRCMFHVSDEPGKDHLKQYDAGKALLTKYIEGSRIMDALSDYELFEQGVVEKPVVCNDHIHTFMEHNVPDLWTYYCCCQVEDVANRFIAMPSYRNRILGWQLYKYNIRGFLHWGFNFWFSQYSKGIIDPYKETSADMAFPAGDAFCVYPLDEAGEVVCSLRLYVLNDGLQDLRALKLLESLAGRAEVESLLQDLEGFTKYPRNSTYCLNLRETVNQKIKELL